MASFARVRAEEDSFASSVIFVANSSAFGTPEFEVRSG